MMQPVMQYFDITLTCAGKARLICQYLLNIGQLILLCHWENGHVDSDHFKKQSQIKELVVAY